MFKKTRHLLRELSVKLSIWKITGYIGGTILLALAVGWLYDLTIPVRLILLGGYLLLLPGIFYWVQYSIYEKKRYQDLNVYIEQLICSFKRSGNVSMALEDCITLFHEEDVMYQILEKALHIRKTGEGVELGKSLTEEAFSCVEKVYPSRRLRMLHEFIVKAENNGGEREHALDLQLNDTQMWKKRTKKFHIRRNDIKLQVMIATILSAVLCYSTKLMTPPELNINLSASASYQLATLFVFLCFGLLIYITLRGLSGTWLDSKSVDPKHEKILRHRYEFVLHYTPRLNAKENLPLCIIGTLLVCITSILSIRFLQGWMRTAGLCLCLLIIVFVTNSIVRTKGRYIKSVCREVEKEFPYFLLGVTLLLQSESLYNAIQITADSTSGIMKTELDKLLEKLYEEPNSIQAFSNFFRDFEVEETKSGMKLLYSISVNGYEGMERQLDFLAEQNNELMGQSEEIAFNNQIAGLGLIKQVPMLIGIVKMVVDLVNVLISVTNTMTGLV